jgi:hypothetical protein
MPFVGAEEHWGDTAKGDNGRLNGLNIIDSRGGG